MAALTNAGSSVSLDETQSGWVISFWFGDSVVICAIGILDGVELISSVGRIAARSSSLISLRIESLESDSLESELPPLHDEAPRFAYK